MYRFYINCHEWKPTREEWIYATRCIAKDEVERTDKFVFQRDAKFALCGQLLIRYLLTHALQRKSSSFEIKRTDRGRPYIESTSKFDFNLSHHHHLVCIAGTFDGQVGCDTMEYRTNTKQTQTIESLVDLLRKEFTETERNFILNKDKDELTRFAHFNRIWCLKEGYVKWIGYGIGFQLSRLNFCVKTDEFDENNPQQVVSDTILELDNKLNNENIRFDEQLIYLPDNEQQLITVCALNKHECQPFIQLTINEILKGCTPLDENTQDEEKWWLNFQRKKNKINKFCKFFFFKLI